MNGLYPLRSGDSSYERGARGTNVAQGKGRYVFYVKKPAGYQPAGSDYCLGVLGNLLIIIIVIVVIIIVIVIVIIFKPFKRVLNILINTLEITAVIWIEIITI